ncbi:hypothetical protein GF339_19085 [candidate division KSB3 bacterium]|uniref:DUF624 domain-containing protein n=1 Tax=candidate division KSB3 bacterium TaxID=2044937 RepID=A0A9D5Q7V3_9BACT|nr:hypothetical protein [candidate division KSB3 bacterium]MBD3326697.1 hypothetical protein [candidate division KSB3 bacterium]
MPMILFTIKKAFFDIWDHLFSIFFINVGFLGILSLDVYLLYFLRIHPLTFMFAIGLALVLPVLYIGAVSMIARDIVEYATPKFKDIGRYLREVWKAALAFCLFILIQAAIAVLIFPWYLKRGGIVGIVIPGILFWISLIWWCASQYYFPLRSQLDTKVSKILRKSLLLLFDNPLFTLVLALGTLLLLAVSVFTILLFPGIGAILVWHQAGLKLRLYKYDYLEDHPDAARDAIPWDELLTEERKNVGTRTLRNTFFPWKE